MGTGELGELGPRGEGIGRGMGTVKLLNGGEISVSESWGGMGAGELGDWDREERRGNWEGNGNNEIVGRFLLVNREQ
ncbi:hypothetical protein Peur_056005 [Populus x canadensis]